MTDALVRDAPRCGPPNLMVSTDVRNMPVGWIKQSLWKYRHRRHVHLQNPHLPDVCPGMREETFSTKLGYQWHASANQESSTSVSLVVASRLLQLARANALHASTSLISNEPMTYQTRLWDHGQMRCEEYSRA